MKHGTVPGSGPAPGASDGLPTGSVHVRNRLRLYFHGAWLNSLAMAGLIGVLVALAPREPTDDFGPLGMGIVFGGFVLLPWLAYSLVVGGAVLIGLRITAGRARWIRITACFVLASGAAAAVPLLMELAVAGSAPPGLRLIVWGLPLLSGAVWAAKAAGHIPQTHAPAKE